MIGWTAAILMTVALTPQQPPALPTAESSDDIVVSALRLPREALPTQVHWHYPSLLDSRVEYQQAMLFMRCAIRSVDTATLRKVVDGEPGTASARFAQGWIIQKNPACPP